MATEIPDLWSDDIRLDVVPPIVILRAQGTAISRRTQGVVRAEVTSTSNESEGDIWETHAFDLLAPALQYRETVLQVTHRSSKVYPVAIRMPDKIEWEPGPSGYSDKVGSYHADEFIEHLRIALRSQPTMAAIAHLIARTNEKRMAVIP